MKNLLFIFLTFFSSFHLHAENDARFVSQSVPLTFEPGVSYNISVTFKNTGTTTWTSDELYRLGTQSPQDNTIWVNSNRVELPHDVPPGEEVTFNITITAPVETGIYILQWRMVQDAVEWFGQMSDPAYFVATPPLQDSLFVEGNHFSVTNHIVSTSFFCWYGEGDWQVNGPWIPLEGRESWDGSVEFWQRMIKEAMAANIDVFYVELIPKMEESRINFFLALNKLRSQGWNVPKISPFLDTEITYSELGYKANCATQEGKDELIGHYIRFFRQYYAANTDDYADDYIYTQDGRPVLDIWHIQNKILNYYLLTRDDVTNRLQAVFGNEHPIFNNDIVMINNAYSPCFNFCDERIYQFEMQQYKIDKLWNGIKSSLLKPGYWDQNVRYPGYFLPRDAGIHLINAWEQVLDDTSINRVYIESFNEYDEGSGIFAARTDTVFRIPTNVNMDTWSINNDPWEYIKTTALGAAGFNDFDNFDAKIIRDNFPAEMVTGEKDTVKVVVQNNGNFSWTNADSIMFGRIDNETSFGQKRYHINDDEDEIPVYGGIFRGRTKTFTIILDAPETAGVFETHWRMLHNAKGWFGETLSKTIEVKSPSGILNGKTDIEMKVYPNPVINNGNMMIKGKFVKNGKFIIYNLSGKIIFKKVLENAENKVTFNIKNLQIKEGVYFVKYYDGETTGVKKFVVQ